MKTLKILVLVTVMLLLVPPFMRTHAQRVSTTTGNALLDACESKLEFQQAFCVGYITGVSDTESFDSAVYKDRRLVCIPDDVTNGQTKDVVVKYLKDHPESRQLNATILIVESLVKAFPCSNR